MPLATFGSMGVHVHWSGVAELAYKRQESWLGSTITIMKVKQTGFSFLIIYLVLCNSILCWFFFLTIQ